MKTEIKKIDSTKRELYIEATGDIIKNKFEEVFKKIAQTARVPGFRQGHAPADIIEKHFSQQAHEQVMHDLIPQFYQQAVEKEGLHVLELPQIEDVTLNRQSISFKAHVEVMPEIALKEYKKLKIQCEPIAVSADELTRSLDSLKEQRKKETADDSFARGLGYPSLDELQKSIERQLAVQKENAQRQKVEQQVLSQITDGLDFKLPQSMVNKQLEDLTRRAKVELAMRGMNKDQIAEQEGKLHEELQEEAKRQVKIYLVLAAIAKKENIAADDHMPAHVMEFLFSHADWQVA